jgi:hypothetical protein
MNFDCFVSLSMLRKRGITKPDDLPSSLTGLRPFSSLKKPPALMAAEVIHQIVTERAG